jgi:hypothetical protein
MRTYERPTLHRVGTFAGLTGFKDIDTGDPMFPVVLGIA